MRRNLILAIVFILAMMGCDTSYEAMEKRLVKAENELEEEAELIYENYPVFIKDPDNVDIHIPICYYEEPEKKLTIFREHIKRINWPKGKIVIEFENDNLPQ